MAMLARVQRSTRFFSRYYFAVFIPNALVRSPPLANDGDELTESGELVGLLNLCKL